MARKKQTEQTGQADQTEQTEQTVPVGQTPDMLVVTVGAPGSPSGEFYAAALGVVLGAISLDMAVTQIMEQLGGMPLEAQRDWVAGMDQAVARLQSVVKELPRRVTVK
jgi:hypothetical protein